MKVPDLGLSPTWVPNWDPALEAPLPVFFHFLPPNLLKLSYTYRRCAFPWMKSQWVVMLWVWDVHPRAVGKKELRDRWFMSAMIPEVRLYSSCHIILILALWLHGLLSCRTVFCFFIIISLLGCQQVWDSVFPSLGLISTSYSVTSGYFTSPHLPFYMYLFFLGSSDFNDLPCEVCLLDNCGWASLCSPGLLHVGVQIVTWTSLPGQRVWMDP